MILDYLLSKSYGVYYPKSNIEMDVDYTSYGKNHFKLHSGIQLSSNETFATVKQKISGLVDKMKASLQESDLELLNVLLGATSTGMSYVISFDTNGVTIASLITVDAKELSFIYEKYNKTDYGFQIALKNNSSLKFSFSESKLTGDFYFNLKKKDKKFEASVTGYTKFHLGNSAAAKPLTISTGIIKRNDKNVVYALLQSNSYDGITITELLKMVTPSSISIPDVLNDVAIRNFAVVYGDGTLALTLDCKIIINNNALDTKLSIAYTKSNKSFAFKGKVKVARHTFNISFLKESENWALLANYNSGTTSTTIKFKELAVQLFGDSVATKVPDLKLDIQNFKAFFYYKKEKNQSKILLGMGAGLDIDMKDLPLAGSILVEAKALKFKEVLALYSNGTFTKQEVAQIPALPKDYEHKEGLYISAELVINAESTLYTIGGTDTTKKLPAKKEKSTPEEKSSQKGKTKPLDQTVSSSAKWSKIDKEIGPINLQRLGIAFKNGKIVVLLDASIKMKGLGAQLMGCGLGFDLEWPPSKPDFYLDGLGLSYKAPPIEISGAFLHSTTTINNETVDVYSGQALIKMKTFSIAAIGSYAKVKDETSLFIYGLFEGSIGGPPFFFVTGIAAGFGYNRKINTPQLDEVAEYPLVALAMQPKDKDINEVLTSLETPMRNGKTPIEISPGDYWFAVGVKFTSFKIVESFLLLTVNLGSKTEFAIFGLSRLSWPEKSISTEPIAYIELAILAHFGPDSDVISVDGLITPNSYILSKDCKLSGGFAFYTWISGEHEGDFVITLGGYHPNFKKPDHYPTVPRIALNWKISENLSIKGELYYALTPSSIMAGGKWEALYQTSNLKVAFMIWVDLLIAWAPFEYNLDVGALLRIQGKIEKAFITVYFNIELKAQLQIWGPPFSGIAEVDFCIFSFTIQFGNKNRAESKHLTWDKFADGFLPKSNKTTIPTPSRKARTLVMHSRRNAQKTNKRTLVTANNTSKKAVDTIGVKLSSGVIQTKQIDTKKYYIANPYNTTIHIDTSIPIKKIKIGNELNADTPLKTFSGNKTYKDREQNIGIKPCGVEAKDADFIMDIEVTLNGTLLNNHTFSYKGLTKGYPEALWGATSSTSNDSKTLKNVLSGLELKPIPSEDVSQLRSFDFSTFLEKSKHPFKIIFKEVVNENRAYQSNEMFGSETETGILEKTYTKPIVKSKREKLFAALGTDFKDFTSGESEITSIMSHPKSYFRGIPILCETGKLPQYPTDTNS